MRGLLHEGVKLSEVVEATCAGCRLAPGEVLRESVLCWPGADIVAAGGDPVSYLTPRNRCADGAWLYSSPVQVIAKMAVKEAVTAALRDKTLTKGAKKQWNAVHEKGGVQILCFDGNCFLVHGAELCHVETIN